MKIADITFMISSGYNFLIGRYVITCLIADHNVFPLLQDSTDANITMHMKNIYDTLAAIQSRLTNVLPTNKTFAGTC